VCECELDAAGYGIFNIERIERDYPHVYGILNNKQRRRNVKVLAPEASALLRGLSYAAVTPEASALLRGLSYAAIFEQVCRVCVRV
jgi:hypothetical protein